MANKIIRRHHFIPQFFLKSFSQRERRTEVINVFDKKSLKEFPRSIEDIGFIKDFHTVIIDGEKSDFFETAHNEIFEKRLVLFYRFLLRKINNVIQDYKVVNCLTMERKKEIFLNGYITEDEKYLLSFLLSYFIVRGKKWHYVSKEGYGRIEMIMRDIARVHKINDIDEKIEKQLGKKEELNLLQLEATFKGDERNALQEKFQNHVMLIGLNLTEVNFYTSDNVHALTSLCNIPRARGIGYSTPGNVIYFPISPKICVIMIDANIIENVFESDKSYIILDENTIKLINENMVLSSVDQVYSIDGKWDDLRDTYIKYDLKAGHKPYVVS